MGKSQELGRMIMEEDHEEEGRTAAEALHLVNCINFGGCLWNEVHWKAVGWGGMQVSREGGAGGGETKRTSSRQRTMTTAATGGTRRRGR